MLLKNGTCNRASYFQHMSPCGADIFILLDNLHTLLMSKILFPYDYTKAKYADKELLANLNTC